MQNLHLLVLLILYSWLRSTAKCFCKVLIMLLGLRKERWKQSTATWHYSSLSTMACWFAIGLSFMWWCAFSTFKFLLLLRMPHGILIANGLKPRATCGIASISWSLSAAVATFLASRNDCLYIEFVLRSCSLFRLFISHHDCSCWMIIHNFWIHRKASAWRRTLMMDNLISSLTGYNNAARLVFVDALPFLT